MIIKSIPIYLKNVVLNYPFLHGKNFNRGEPFQYEAEFILDKDTEIGQYNYLILKNAINKLKKIAKIDVYPRLVCLKDGDKRNKLNYKNKWYVMSMNFNKPLLLDTDLTPLPYTSVKLYAGCIVNTKLDISLMKKQKHFVIKAHLNTVQFVKDGVFLTNHKINK